MSLGKRPRSTTSMMKRTISVSELVAPGLVVSDPNPRERQRVAVEEMVKEVAPMPTVPPPAGETAEFLRACGICKRNLGPGRDTFIYRGDAAFCSLECREKQIKLDALKEKCSQMLRKAGASPPKPRPESSSGNSEPVVAV